MKGSMLDIPIIIAVLAGGIIAVILGAYVLGEFSSAWTFGGDTQTILDAGINAFNVFDYMIVFFAVGVSLFSVASAFFIRTHPIFFIFSVVLLGIVIMFSAQVSNALDIFLTVPLLAATVNDFPLTLTLARNLPFFSLIVGIMIAIAMYGKSGDTGGRI